MAESFLSEAIMGALAPGVAMSSGVLFSSTLQSRYLALAQGARELNAEARAHILEHGGQEDARMRSVRRQVEALAKRCEVLRRSVVAVNGGVFGFILTILLLFLEGVFPGVLPKSLPLACFGGGLVVLALACLSTAGELAISQRTLWEDIRTSFEGSELGAPSAKESVGVLEGGAITASSAALASGSLAVGAAVGIALGVGAAVVAHQANQPSVPAPLAPVPLGGGGR